MSALANVPLAIDAPAPDMVVTAHVEEATTIAVAQLDRPSFTIRLWSVRSLHERALARPRATNHATLRSMAVLETVLEQALQLTDDERGELIARLLRSLEPDDGEEVIGDDWEAAWSTELDNRVREIRDGSIELIDGDEAIAKVRAAIDARRP